MYNALLTVQYIGLAILIFEILFILFQESSKLQRDMILLLVSLLIVFAAYTVEMKSRSMDAAFTAARFGYLGKPFLVLTMLFLVLDYCRIQIPDSLAIALLLLQGGFTAVVFTTGEHKLYYTSITFSESGLFPHMEVGHGILYAAYMMDTLVFCIVIFGICLRQLKQLDSKMERRQIRLFMAMVLAPLVMLGIFQTKILRGYDCTLVGYLLATIGFSVSFLQLNMFDTITLAKEQVVDYIHGGLLVYDERNRLIYHNDLADHIGIIDKVATYAEEHKPYMYENRVYSVEERDIVRDDVVYGHMYFIQDVTERYRYERNLEKEKKRADAASEAKSEFLFSMSHDIRTPMNAILGMTKIAKVHIDEKDKVDDCLKKIEMSGQHLLELINGILDMNKIESGKLELADEPFDLSDMLEEVITIATPLANSMEHTFLTEVGGITHKAVRGDRSRLSQILTNIIGNAVKYTERGGKIRFSAAEDEKNAQRTDGAATFIFEVEDNGIGMSEDYLPVIFDPFTRAKEERVKKIQGSGLGMAITKNFVEMMGGDIAVKSALGVGSCFTVKVTLRLQTEEEIKSQTKKVTLEDLESLNLSAKRVLLVEDFEINAEIAGEILGMIGIPVEYAINGKEAVEMLKRCEDGYYDLVFMDIMMPVMNGYEATRAIRAIDREYTKTVPIVAMTANAFEEDIKNAEAAGMNGHIAKPLDLDHLMTVIKKWLCEA